MKSYFNKLRAEYTFTCLLHDVSDRHVTPLSVSPEVQATNLYP